MSLEFLSKDTLIFRLFISEIPRNQTGSDQSHFLEAGIPKPGWLTSVGMLVTAVTSPLRETFWQACNYLQAQEAKLLFSVKKNELTMTFLFILCNSSVNIS